MPNYSGPRVASAIRVRLSDDEAAHVSDDRLDIDLTAARDIMRALDDELQQIDGMRMRTDEPGSGGDPRKAQFNRQMLHAEHLARLLASEVAVQYWRLRGFDDPREL